MLTDFFGEFAESTYEYISNPNEQHVEVNHTSWYCLAYMDNGFHLPNFIFTDIEYTFIYVWSN